MTFMAGLPDKAYELAIVDPPYGIGQHGGTSRSKFVRQKNGTRIFCMDGQYSKKHWDIKTPKDEYFIKLKQISANQIIWGANYQSYPLPGGRIIWDKVKDESGYSKAEIAYCSLHKSVQMFRYMWNGMLQGKSIEDGTIQRGNKDLNEIRIHPTQKPVALYRWLLTNYAKPGQTILDTHGGSFSSAIACWHEGYNMDICEIDSEYFDAACERFERETRQQKLFNPLCLCASV
jgi:site-specific DNA-methyltransferase (adenine-specific)